MELSREQVQRAVRAAYEVLNGADSSRVLQLMDDLIVARRLLGEVIQGNLVIGREHEGQEAQQEGP